MKYAHAFVLAFVVSGAQAGQVKLAWDASDSPGVNGYEVYYGKVKGVYGVPVDAGNVTTYTVTGLDDNATYYLAAKAYNDGKTIRSVVSNEVVAQALPDPITPPAGSSGSLWDSTTKPSLAATSDTGAVEVGVKFRSDVDGVITAMRFYKGTGNVGPHVGKLWSSTGTLLGSVAFVDSMLLGWQQVNLQTPVPITANTTYVASYHAPVGRYAFSGLYFTAEHVKSPLRALASVAAGGNGVYKYGASGFPTTASNGSNYWVDVVFSSAVTPPPPPPTAGSALSCAGGAVVKAMGAGIQVTCAP